MKDLFWYPLFVLFIRWPCKEAKKKAKFIESLFIVQIIVHSHYRAIYNATYRYFMVIGVALLNSSSIQEHQHKDYAHRRSELEKSHEMSANFERRRSPSKTNHNDYFFTLNGNMITFFTVNKALFVRGLVERQIHVPFCWRHCFPIEISCAELKNDVRTTCEFCRSTMNHSSIRVHHEEYPKCRSTCLNVRWREIATSKQWVMHHS